MSTFSVINPSKPEHSPSFKVMPTQGQSNSIYGLKDTPTLSSIVIKALKFPSMDLKVWPLKSHTHLHRRIQRHTRILSFKGTSTQNHSHFHTIYQTLWSSNTPSACRVHWAESRRFSGSPVLVPMKHIVLLEGSQEQKHSVSESSTYMGTGSDLNPQGTALSYITMGTDLGVASGHTGNIRADRTAGTEGTCALPEPPAPREHVITFQFSTSTMCPACRWGCEKMKSGEMTPWGCLAEIVWRLLDFDFCAPSLIDILLQAAVSPNTKLGKEFLKTASEAAKHSAI